MKCPSRSASAARNSARISSSLIISSRHLSPLGPAFNTRSPAMSEEALETVKSHAYRAGQFRRRASIVSGSNNCSGEQMKRIGWAIALAAAWLTPAAAQAPASSPPTSTPAAAQPANAPAAGFAQDARKPDAATATPAQEPVAAALPTVDPTPGIGEPDGRMSLQDQVTPIGREAASFHDYWLLPLCAIISIVVLALLLWSMVRYRRSANPTPSRNSHNTTIEGVWTLVPVLILVLIAIPSIRLLRHTYSPPPADLTIKVTGHQWYWSYEYPDNGVTFDSYMLKEANDPTRQKNQRARTDADGPPLLAADERMVIPVGKVVKFIVTADDVIHSFAVPAFWVKQDANPGQLHEAWAKVDRPGVYFGQCSELCGARHGFMPIAVEVVPAAEFATWVASKGGHMAGAAPPAPNSTAISPVSTSNIPVPTQPPPPPPPSGAAPAVQQPATAQN